MLRVRSRFRVSRCFALRVFTCVAIKTAWWTYSQHAVVNISIHHWGGIRSQARGHTGRENRQTWQIWPIQPDILSPPLLRLTSRKPLWLDLQPVNIKSRWRHNWKSAQVVNSHLVCDPTIWQPGFDLPRLQWSLLNHFLTEQGHCGACRRKWRLTDTDLCPCGERRDPDDVSHCRILSPWQNWMAAYLGYTLQLKTLFHDWSVMAHETHTRRRRSLLPTWVNENGTVIRLSCNV